MTERSAEQPPVETRPDRQDTARIPLGERLQRRITAASEDHRSRTEAARESARVLPPLPPELSQQRTEQEAVAQSAPAAAPSQASPRRTPAEPAVRAVQPLPDETAEVAPVRAPTATTATTATTRRTGAATGPRRARLRLSRIDPWSVMKVSFVLAIAFGIVTVVSVFLVWSVLDAAGVWSSINNTVSDTVSSPNNVSTFNIEDYLGMSRVLGFTMLVSVIDVILITAIATLGAFLYNMAASLLGGIEVTLAEDA
jgi:hypothetical protein